MAQVKKIVIPLSNDFVISFQFDVNSWLATHKPKLADINQLVQLILQGLECWNKNESALIQGVSWEISFPSLTILYVIFSLSSF